MALSRGELKGQILRLLNKTAAYPGFYDDDKINDSLQEAFDFVAVEMFIAGEGWTDKIAYIDTVPNMVTTPIRESMAMLKSVRYLVGDVYVPMTYDDQMDQPQYSDETGAQPYVSTYRIMNNQLYFNPALSEGGEKFIQIEYTDFPKYLVSDDDVVEPQFNRAFTHYIKYRTASILAASLEKFVCPWQAIENSWYKKMKEIVVKRNLRATQIREFGDD